MTKLKIAMLTTFYPPYSFGGDAIGVERLATAMAKQGHHVTVIHDIDAFATLSNTTNLSPTPISPAENINVIGLRSNIGFISNLMVHQLGRPVIHRKQLQVLLQPGAFDIVWFHNISLLGGPALLSYGDGLKIYEAHEHWLVCPTHVLWRHNRELCDSRQCFRCAVHYRRPPQLWRYLGFLERQLEHVDVFIAKSEFSRKKHKEFGFSKNMEVVPYFLPEKPKRQQSNQESPHNRPYFLFVGRLEKIKGLDDVIPVFADYPEADLLILGTGEYEEALKQQATNISNVKFIGRLPPQDLSRYYESAIALIVPSVCFETFGIIIIESFREGTPVIARRIGPFVEIINQCDGGLLYSDNNELVEAMRELQTKPPYRQAMAKSAKLGFETNWSEKAVLPSYYQTVYQAALAKGNTYVAAALEKEI
jgi:glycosyltransferase involved in cell wall biosynthesis